MKCQGNSLRCPPSIHIQFFFNCRHQHTGFDTQRVGDFEKGFQGGLPFTPFDGTQVGPADAGKPAEQFLGLFLFFPKMLNDPSHND